MPLHKINGIIRKQIGDVCGVVVLFACAVNVQLGIIINALTPEAHPIIESLTRLVVVMPHVPFPDEGGLVAVLLKVFREEPDGVGNGRLVIHHLMVMRQLAGKNTCPAWRTERRRDKGILQMCTLSRNPVHARRFQLGHFPHEPHKIVAVIIGKNKDHVGAGMDLSRLLTASPKHHHQEHAYSSPVVNVARVSGGHYVVELH